MRSNFQMMKAMAEHTQMIPEKRRARLLELSRRWHATPESVRELDSFNVDIGKQLIEFDGRALPQEEMLFGNKTVISNITLIAVELLMKYAILFTKSSARTTIVLTGRTL